MVDLRTAFLLLAMSWPLLAAAERSDCNLPANLAIVPVEQDESWAVDWWKDRHASKIEQAGKVDVDLLFIGDSITHGWENVGAAIWQKHYQDRNAFNLGFSGDRTEHVLWRIGHGALDSMKPKLVVLLIGTNNTGHRMDPAGHTAEGVGRVVESVRAKLPDTRVLILGIFPRHVSPCNEMRIRNREIDQELTQLDDGEMVHFLDVGNEFLEADGTLRVDLMPDLLHLNEAGYAAWAEAMEPTIRRLLQEPYSGRVSR